MLERKRKQTTHFDISDKSASQQSKKLCFGISDCVLLIAENIPQKCHQELVSEMCTNIPRSVVDISAVSSHMQMKVSSDTYVGMDVDREDGKFDANIPDCHTRTVPRCAKCAAGQGGHISHLQS